MAGLFLSRVGSSWLRGSFLPPRPFPPRPSLEPGFGGDSPSGDTGPRLPQTRSPCRGVRSHPAPTLRSLGSYPQPRTPAHAPSPLFLRCRDGRFLAPGGRWPRPSPRTGHRSAPLRKWSPSWRRGRRASQRVWGRGGPRPGPRGSSDSGPWGSQAALIWRRSPTVPEGPR